MRWATALAVAAVTLVAVACDGGDGAAPASSSPPSSPASGPSTTATTSAVTSDASTPAATPTVPPTVAASGTTVPSDGTGPQVLGPLGSTELAIDTGEGSVQIGGGTIPAVAVRVPAPDDLVVQLATEANGSAGYSATSPQSVAELGDFYASALPDAGFEITEDRTAGSARFLAFQGLGGVGQVAISPEPGGAGSTVIVAFGPPG